MNYKYINLLIISSLLSLYLISCSSKENAIIILNMPNEAVLPKNFRSSNDGFKIKSDLSIDTEGLASLNISGSGQFSEKSLETILQRLDNPPNFYILDLRQESHGFLNGIAVSWYSNKNWDNVNKPLSLIEKEEKSRLEECLRLQQVKIFTIVKKDIATGMLIESLPEVVNVKSAITEKELASQLGLNYLRLEVVDHLKPTDTVVDQFVTLATSLPEPRWLHIHCAAGKGRTTTFMAMYDMIFNAKKVSFEDIMHRQWLLGGKNLFDIQKKKKWKAQHGMERIQFIERFYGYCRDNQDNFATSWSEYAKNKGSM